MRRDGVITDITYFAYVAKYAKFFALSISTDYRPRILALVVWSLGAFNVETFMDELASIIDLASDFL